MGMFMGGHIGQVITALADKKGRTTREVAAEIDIPVQQVSNALGRLRRAGLVRSREQGRAGTDGRAKFMWFITADGLAALEAVQHRNGTTPDPEPTPEGPPDMAHLTAPTAEQLAATAAALAAEDTEQDNGEPGYIPLSGDVATPTAPTADYIRVTVEILREGTRHNYRAIQYGGTVNDARDVINEVAADAVDAAFTSRA